MVVTILCSIVFAVIGVAVGYFVRQMIGQSQATSMEQRARLALKDAERDADTIRKEASIHAKAEVLKAREDFEASVKSRRQEISALEERISQRELNLDRKVALLDKKEHAIEDKTHDLEQRLAEVNERQAELQRLVADERVQLQRIAQLSQDEARNIIMERIEKDLQSEIGALIRRNQEHAKETSEREARKIVAQAVQRCAVSHAGQITTTSIVLPSDDVKGRIIGREGRNIRALEAATGVNILIDDTPEAVVISGFDALRREVASKALEALIADGRIHPARIEEVVARAEDEINETIREVGEQALFEVGLQDADPAVIRKIGRLKYRTSYSQNVLQHSIEVAQLMGIMAGELGLDVSLAKRVGMLHDVGKAMDHEVEGGHAQIGADFLKKHGEDFVVINAIAAHHEDIAGESIYAVLCMAADAISSSRLGARSETTEIYLKRLEKLEEIANEFDGVRKSFAIQAGREVRLLVDPEKIDDNEAMVLARNVSKRIENDLKYPGQIRIVVIRETRCVEYAK